MYNNVGGVVLLIIVTVIIVVVGGGAIYTAVNLGDEALSLSITKAEAEREAARVSRVEAEASLVAAKKALVEGQATLKYAEAELELKRAQGRALTIAANASADTVKTANRLTTYWGMTFPMLPPLYLVIGASFGVLAASGIAYSLGHRAGVRFILRNSVKDVMEFVDGDS